MRRFLLCTLISLSIFFCVSSHVQAAVPAFPGAEGWGADALAGCDKSKMAVVFVTSLADNGDGTLRAALTTNSPRYVIFKVGGNITLKSPIEMRGDLGHSCVYVAGQSAPGSGVLITADSSITPINMVVLQSNIHDVVFRDIRFRGNTKGNIEINYGHDIIFDHCSFSWTSNDSVDIWRADSSRGGPIDKVTIQRSIHSEIYDVHSTAFNIGGEHAFGYEKQVDHISLHHNLIGHDNYRNPNVSAVSIDVINNVMYNWKYKSTIVKMGVKADVIANYYKPGPMTHIESDSPTDPDRYRPIVHESTNEFLTPFPDKASLYIVQNVRVPDFMDTLKDNWILLYDEGLHSAVDPVFKRSPWQRLPSSPRPISLTSAFVAYDSIVGSRDVGASEGLRCDGTVYGRNDRVDTRIIDDATNGTQWFNLKDVKGTFRPPDNLSEAGGLPPADVGTPCTDTDNDGMPDKWEIVQHTDPLHDDHSQMQNGFTMLELYLNRAHTSGGSNVNGPSPSPTRSAISLSPTSSTVQCSMKSKGDADCNNLINDVDYSIWKDEFFRTRTSVNADFDKDAGVSLLDYVIWMMGKGA